MNERIKKFIDQIDQNSFPYQQGEKQNRYQWLVDNAASWSWQPARYNAEKISGFAYKGTGYLGYSFEEAVSLAMGEATPPAEPVQEPVAVQEPVSDAEVEAWAERHDIQGTATDLRCMFEDAASFSGPPAVTPVQEPEGRVMVSEDFLLNIKQRVNTLATLSLKRERYEVAIGIKQDIADKLREKNGNAA